MGTGFRFTDNEMVAFNPGVMPPGLLPSDDKLLHSRIMSYSDAQRYRSVSAVIIVCQATSSRSFSEGSKHVARLISGHSMQQCNLQHQSLAMLFNS